MPCTGLLGFYFSSACVEYRQCCHATVPCTPRSVRTAKHQMIQRRPSLVQQASDSSLFSNSYRGSRPSYLRFFHSPLWWLLFGLDT
jgi:hypothetical protein